MFNIDEIKELIALLEESSLSVLEVKDDDKKVRLEKAQTTAAAPAAVTVNAAPVQAAPVAEQAPAVEVEAPAEEETTEQTAE